MMNLIRENRYIGGPMLDVDIFTVKKTARQRKARSKPTSETQAKLNQKNSEKKLRRILHLNFAAGCDLELHLTFDRMSLPADDETHEREVRNFIRRLKRLYHKKGAEELKYIVILGGRSGERRRHAHLTISGSDKVRRSEIQALWKLGVANADILQDKDDKMFVPLSRYISGSRQTDRSLPDSRGQKRWWGSRNLQQPKAEERTGYLSQRMVRDIAFGGCLDVETVERIYPGCRVVDYEVSESDIFGGIYLNILLRQQDNKPLKGG